MKQISLIVEYPLSELQTGDALKKDITISNCCALCGKPIKNNATKMIQLLTNGNIVSTDQEIENSQGFFPVGSECEKRLVLSFAF